MLRSLPLSSVNHGKKEDAKAQKSSPAPVRPTFTHGTLSSVVKKLLLNSRLMLESLENSEVTLLLGGEEVGAIIACLLELGLARSLWGFCKNETSRETDLARRDFSRD